MGSSKKTLKILYDVEAWAYHHRANALAKYASPDFDVSLAAFNRFDGHPDACYDAEIERVLNGHEPDILFALSTTEVTFLRRALIARGWKTKLLASWNNGWPVKQAAFKKVYANADAVVVNNFECWQKMGRLRRTYSISNGVDLGIFRNTVPAEWRQTRVLWTGSEYHRITKGYDEYILPLMDILEREGIDCEALLVDSMGNDKRSPEEMAGWYNQGTVLVCASETEGTPNPALEAAACGCTIVSTAVGNMPELIRNGENGYLVDRSVDSLHAAIKESIKGYKDLSRQLSLDIEKFSWATKSERFYTLFRELADSKTRAGETVLPTHPDLSSEITVFVSTVGANSFETCIEHLRGQDCSFKLEVIDHVAPMSAAFQQMLDNCTTPYYVQVDEDMLLEPQAVRTLHENIKDADENVAIFCASLWDDHLDRAICGVKIYRHEIVQRYPYIDVQSCEKNQLRRLQKDNYLAIIAPVNNLERTSKHVLGRHGADYTRASIYERYFSLEAKRLKNPSVFSWLEEYRNRFMQQYIEDPSELNFFALMGLAAGGQAAFQSIDGEKDFRLYDELPGFKNAIKLFKSLTSPDDNSQMQIDPFCKNTDTSSEEINTGTR